jgi:hypothetical protein
VKVFYFINMDELVLISDADLFLLEQAKIRVITRFGDIPIWPVDVVYIGVF